MGSDAEVLEIMAMVVVVKRTTVDEIVLVDSVYVFSVSVNG